jgi:hypothetical protein
VENPSAVGVLELTAYGSVRSSHGMDGRECVGYGPSVVLILSIGIDGILFSFDGSNIRI